jgi:hypothetical protein
MGEVTRKFLERRNDNISIKQVVLSFANMYYFIHKGGQDSYFGGYTRQGARHAERELCEGKEGWLYLVRRRKP